MLTTFFMRFDSTRVPPQRLRVPQKKSGRRAPERVHRGAEVPRLRSGWQERKVRWTEKNKLAKPKLGFALPVSSQREV